VQTNAVHIFDPILVEISSFMFSKFSRYSRLQGVQGFKAYFFFKFEKLETWNCLHKTVTAVSHNFKGWCDLRANLHYGLKHFLPCSRS